MKKIRKLVAIALATIMITSLVSCQSNQGETEATTYKQEVKGHNGNIIVQVIANSEKIVDVKVLEHSETAGLSDEAINEIPKQIVEKQSIAIDTVSGATVSSNAILLAVEEALKEAGADIEKFKVKNDETAKLEKGETETTNVVIVGAGVAGIMGGIELKTNYPDVNFIIVEKLPTIGGSLPMTGGAVIATDSKQHKEEGRVTTAEEIANYLDQNSKEEVNSELIKNSFALSGDTLDIFKDMGVPFQETLTVSSPYNDEIYALWADGQGAEFQKALAAKVPDYEMDLRLKTTATELIVENNEVKGVVVQDNEKEYSIMADKVILATGGFGANKEMVELHDPEYANGVIQANGGATGDGFKMVEKFNIPLVGDGTMGTVVATDGSAVINSTFYVDMDGKRFTNETHAKYVFQHDLVRKGGGKAVAIVDSTYEDMDAIKAGIEAGLVKEFNSLEELAKGMDLNVENLTAEVEKYKSAVSEGKNPDFDLPVDKAQSLEKAPFYAQVAVPRTFGTITGLKINGNTQLVNDKDEPIKNLFAVGELTAGNAISTKYPGAGFGLAYAANTGRLAAIEAAKELNK